MKREEKIEIWTRCLARDYNIDEDKARKLINDLDLDDKLDERYEDEIRQAEEEQEQKWELEEELNKFENLNIHGGI